MKDNSILIKKRKDKPSTIHRKIRIKYKRVPISFVVSRIKQQSHFIHQIKKATLQPDLNRHSWYTNNVLPLNYVGLIFAFRMARLELASPVPKTGMLLLHTLTLKHDASFLLLMLTMCKHERNYYFMGCVLALRVLLSCVIHEINDLTILIYSCI